MKKRTGILWFGVIIGAAYGLYEVKWQVRELREQNVLAEAQIHKERRALEVLAAEWAYLTRPERLQTLAQKHLPNLVAGDGTQMADMAEYPPQTAGSEGDKAGITYSSYSVHQE